MSINTMKLALEALENASPAAWASRVDSDTMKSIWRKHADALKGLRVLLAELDNASCKSAQKRLEAQQPASKEHLFELWWEAHMPNATQEKAWTAFTAAVASNGVGIAAQQPATPEPLTLKGAMTGMVDAQIRDLWPTKKESATPEPFGFVHHFVAKDANGVIDTTWEADGCSDPMPHPMHPDKWSWSHAEPFYTHSAPPVPDDVVRDAERYRWLADCNNYEASIALISDTKLTAHTLGEKIDAAMLAAKEASA